ncbi:MULTISPECIES: hypothetical protein [Oscillatoriales]|nr:hypothetical protein [Limnospira sp. Paracas R14]
MTVKETWARDEKPVLQPDLTWARSHLPEFGILSYNLRLGTIAGTCNLLP